jgi:hypothetical protein
MSDILLIFALANETDNMFNPLNKEVMSKMVISASVINDTIESAIGSLYEVENLNDILMDNDLSLAENGDFFKVVRKYLNGLKKEYISALTKYDDLAVTA